MTHRNARLTPVTRAELVERVLVGWPQVEVARLFRVSRATVAKCGYGGSAKADRTRSLTAPAVPCAAPARPIS